MILNDEGLFKTLKVTNIIVRPTVNGSIIWPKDSTQEPLKPINILRDYGEMLLDTPFPREQACITDPQSSQDPPGFSSPYGFQSQWLRRGHLYEVWPIF